MNLWERIKNNKLVLGFLVFDLIAIIILIILNILNLFRSATIDISVVPLDATVTINGKKYDNNSSYNVFPSNNAKVEISHPDLESKSFTVDLKRNSTTSIREYLTGKDGDFSYYAKKSHRDDLDALRTLADNSFKSKDLSAFLKKVAIVEVLPITFSQPAESKYDLISISIAIEYKQCKKQSFCLVVTDLTGKNTELARSLIKENGYNPDEYEIIYESDPFFVGENA